MTDVHSQSADSTGAGAPADRIKVTPAMIRAGAAVLWNGDVPDCLSMSPTYAEDLARQILERGLEAHYRGRLSVRRRAA